MHGEIHVKSEPGQRTTFTVCLRKGKAHFEDSDLMETSVSHQAYEASRLDDSETKGDTFQDLSLYDTDHRG